MLNNFILSKAANAETIIESIFEPMNFVSNLKYMLSGMVAIFLVIGVIVLITMIINKIFSK